ncbi:MAG: hypothetical protein VX764_08810 [Planctomycetota bacterium]|nr:hypothetical protein [Planctomycetota bacterium]
MGLQPRVGLIITLLAGLLAAELLHSQAARPIRATRLQRIPAGVVGAQPVQIQAVPQPFPALPPNHFVGQDCTSCHDPDFMAAFMASIGGPVDLAQPTDDAAPEEQPKISIAAALISTSLNKPRTIEEVLAARRDLAFGGLPEMPDDDSDRQKQANTRAQRIALMIRSGNWNGYQQELDACQEQAPEVHENVVQLLARRDQALLPEEVLDLATVNLPDGVPAAVEPTSTQPGEVEEPGEAGSELVIDSGAEVILDNVEVTSDEDQNDKLISSYAVLLKKAATRGSTRTLLQRLEQGVGRFGGSDPENRARACDLLVAADLHAEAKPYLDPLPEEGNASGELRIRHGLYHRAVAAKEKHLKVKREHQVRSADLFAAVAEDSSVDAKDRTRSVTLLTELLPALPPTWTSEWRTRVFSGEGAVGQAMLAHLGQSSRKLFQNRGSSTDQRLDLLRAIKTAVSSLLDQVGDQIGPWQASIDVLAVAFADEANLSLGRPVSTAANRRPSRPIPAKDLVDAAPDGRWIGAIAPSLRQACTLAAIACAARADEPAQAMEALRAVATDPAVDISELASTLVSEWQRNLDPNRPDDEFFSSRIITSTGVFISSFGGQPSAPLTRSKQRRSLRQLGEMVTELKALGVPDIDWEVLVNAFTASHSQAEVYRLEDIEELFGSFDELPGEVAEPLAMAMWRQLQRNWRSPELQQSKGTRRTTKELQEEVERGYRLAQRLAQHAAQQDPIGWRPQMLAGNLYFDLGEYWRELDPDLERYVPQREAAFARYSDSIRIYTEGLTDGRERRNVIPHLQWFTSALGASELSFLTMTTKPENDQVGLLIDAFNSLDADEVREHRGLFASAVENAIGRVPADLRSRFVRHAMRVIGDHPLGRGTRRLARLYEDLESEVELHVSIDGGTDVGVKPFGVRIGLRYTDALERETGGFDLYMRNQVYVRLAPQPMDYRDDFESRIREAFDEHFEIEALQFNSPDFRPYSFQRPGWMEKSFAYLILRAKDPSVDLLPEVRIDLDFKDGTNGSVRVPVVSAVIPIVATEDSGERPTEGDIQVEVTLDDRELDLSKLKLEVLAQGLGVLPDLNGIIPGWQENLVASGFPLAEIDGLLDNGLNVVKIDDEIIPVVPQSERSWTINLQIPDSLSSSEAFQFPAVAEGIELTCKKYSDFDIVELEEPKVMLQIPTKGLPDWAIMTIGGIIAVLFLIILGRKKKVEETVVPRWQMPEEVSALSVTHLLRRIEEEHGLIDENDLPALQEEVATIEARYFSEQSESQVDLPDLKETAQQWLNRSRN